MSEATGFRFGFALLVLGFTAEWCFAQQAGGGGRIVERFRQLDQDDNGALTLEELDRPAEIFKAMDGDGSGTVTLAEVTAYFRARARGGQPGAQTRKASPTEYPGEITEAMPVTLETCRTAAEYSTKANGHAVLVMVDGETVYERYDNGWDKDTPHRLASGTKSFAGVTAAAAVQDGLFEFDDKVSDTINEWSDDPKRTEMTIRQLLSLTSGIEPGENSVVLPYAGAIEAKAKHAPGSKFEYGPNPFQIFGEVMRPRSVRGLTAHR